MTRNQPIRFRRRRREAVAAVLATVLSMAILVPAGCGPAAPASSSGAGGAPARETTDPAGPSAGVAHVDSIFPIEEEIRRFRATIPEEPADLGPDAARSMDELVARLVRAIEVQDTVSLRTLVLNRAEFAYLYYPHSPYSRKPWELPPGLLWFQLQQNGEKGIVRALRRFGGQRGELGEYRCGGDTVVEGPNRIWKDCRTAVRGPDGATEWKRLFGSVIERDGLYKFVSYGNDL